MERGHKICYLPISNRKVTTYKKTRSCRSYHCHYWPLLSTRKMDTLSIKSITLLLELFLASSGCQAICTLGAVRWWVMANYTDCQNIYTLKSDGRKLGNYTKHSLSRTRGGRRQWPHIFCLASSVGDTLTQWRTHACTQKWGSAVVLSQVASPNYTTGWTIFQCQKVNSLIYLYCS